MKDIEHQQSVEVLPSAPRRWRQRVRRAIVLYLLVPYFSVTLIFVIFQRKLVYHPTVAESLRVEAVGLDPEFVRDVQIQTTDDKTLNGWLLKQSKHNYADKAPLVIYFPGNSLNRFERMSDLREIATCGFDVLIFDYRGYGDNSGTPSEKKLSSDAKLIWEYARYVLKYDEKRIVIFGESLGGAVALSLWSTEIVKPPQPAGLILSSTFASMPITVAWHYPMFPFRYLLLDRWPSIDRIARVDAPITIYHGTADKMVPVAHGRELSQASGNSRFIEIAGATHNEIPMHRLRADLENLLESMEHK